MYVGNERCIQGFGSGEAEGKNCLEDRRRWEDNITMDLKEIRLEGV
jgi:hypothetical protein